MKREGVQKTVPDKLLPCVAFHSRQSTSAARKEVVNIHHKKLLALSEEQERPLFTVLDEDPPGSKECCVIAFQSR